MGLLQLVPNLHFEYLEHSRLMAGSKSIAGGILGGVQYAEAKKKKKKKKKKKNPDENAELF